MFFVGPTFTLQSLFLFLFIWQCGDFQSEDGRCNLVKKHALLAFADGVKENARLCVLNMLAFQ